MESRVWWGHESEFSSWYVRGSSAWEYLSFTHWTHTISAQVLVVRQSRYVCVSIVGLWNSRIELFEKPQSCLHHKWSQRDDKSLHSHILRKLERETLCSVTLRRRNNNNNLHQHSRRGRANPFLRILQISSTRSTCIRVVSNLTLEPTLTRIVVINTRTLEHQHQH